MSDLKHARMMLTVAQKDFKALEGMRDASVFADSVFGFHVQQAAEKALKSWLALKGVGYPKTHDLGLLFQLLKQQKIDVVPFLELLAYEFYAVQFRYEELAPDEDPIDRQKALADVESLVSHVQRLLGETEVGQ